MAGKLGVLVGGGYCWWGKLEFVVIVSGDGVGEIEETIGEGVWGICWRNWED